MFERYTEKARYVVVKAQDEARGLKHNHIGTEHILLGLLGDEDTVAAHVLGEVGINAVDVRAYITSTIGEGDEVKVGQISFTPRAKKVLELGLREALSLGHNYIGPGHVLLGLIRESDGVAAKYLESQAISAEIIRNAVIRELSGRPKTPGPPNLSGVLFALKAVQRSLALLETRLNSYIESKEEE